MRRVFALLAVCWTMSVDTQLLTSVSSGVGDDSVTFNCGGTFEQTNATGYFTINPNVAQFDTPNGIANPVSAGVTVLQGSGNQSNAVQWSLWYATGGANYSDDYSLGYDVCAFTFPTWSTNTLLRAQSDTGNCYATFDEDCVSALESAASGYANDLINNATPNPNSNLTAARLPRVCYDVGQALEQNFPSECQKFMNDSLALTTGGFPLTGNGSSPLYNGCDLTTSENDQTYHLLTTVNAVVPPSQRDAYYTAFNWQVLPSLLTFMPLVNDDPAQSIGTSNSKMACLRATQVEPGSQKPYAAPTPTPLGGSGLSGGAIAGIVVGVVVGVALIAGLAFWFWRRRRAQRKQTSAEAAAQQPPAYTDAKEQPQQPAVAEAPADTGIKELSPDNEVRPELADNYKPELKRGNTDAPIELPAEGAPNTTR